MSRFTVFMAVSIFSYAIFWLISSWDQWNFLSPSLIHETIDNQQLMPKYISENISGFISREYIRHDGLVEGEGSGATSESQSYGMLMAVYSNKQEMFDIIWKWTKDNLQTRQNDKLFSWLWENGKISDTNPATDADQDIAYALYLASKQWGNEKYRAEAKEIVKDIWNVETKEIVGMRYVAAGNWAVAEKNGVIINPSYLAPYEYRIFAELDPEHNWLSIVDSSYAALNVCTGSSGLAMDWCQLNSKGDIVPKYHLGKKDGSVHSYDALRVPYRVALDYKLNSEPRALEYLQKDSTLPRDWKEQGKIFSAYSQTGKAIQDGESLAAYGAWLAALSVIDGDVAQEVFEKKIAFIDMNKNIDFYDLAWLWFGLRVFDNSTSI